MLGEITIKSGNTLFQWDVNQSIILSGPAKYVDYDTNADPIRVEVIDGECRIPDEWLKTPGYKKIYICLEGDTRTEKILCVNERPQPPDYISTPTQKITFEALVQRVNDEIENMEERAEAGDFDGEDGYTPIKGVDYFTPADVEEIVNEVKEEVGTPAWSDLTGKPFESIGTGLEVDDDGALNATATLAEWGNITGDIDDQTDLAAALADKQDSLTADYGIIITTDNKIKVNNEVIADVDYVDANITDTMNFIIQERDTERAARIAGDDLLQGSIDGIEAKIPTQASAQNQLADKDFVNSSINSVSAFPITYNAAGDGFPTIGDLTGATVYYSGGVVRVPTTNDYAFVIADTSKATIVSGYQSFTTTAEYVGYYVMYNNVSTLVTADNKDNVSITPGTTVAYVAIPSTRYVYSIPEGQTTGAWNFQAKVSEINLTAAQVKAINSGITDTLVAMIQNGVRFTAQSLTSAEKAQARTNIGAAATTDIPTLSQRVETWEKPDGTTESVTYYVASGGIPSAAGEEF